ncbi:hypothetical protein [Coleofasciculus sp.]|uniref:hypothetical protein n=1 Tax=Coleofasciculus sp. TaxID=3100458 RepID=UPI003A3E281F
MSGKAQHVHATAREIGDRLGEWLSLNDLGKVLKISRGGFSCRDVACNVSTLIVAPLLS